MIASVQGIVVQFQTDAIKQIKIHINAKVVGIS